MKSKLLLIVIITTIMLMGASAVFAAQIRNFITATYIIHPDDLQGWAFFNETGSGSNFFMPGPGTPPLGSGSVQLKITGIEDGYILYKPAWGGTRLSEFTTLTYSTYHDPASQANDVLQPNLVINIDYDLTDGDTSWQGRLVYEPFRTPGNNPGKGSWQTWNTLNGLWYATNAPGNTICPSSNPCTIGTFLSYYPNIGVSTQFTGIGFKVGRDWADGFIGNVDNFVIGINGLSNTYDYEPLTPLEVTDLDLWETTDPVSDPWEKVAGSYAGGFYMILDPTVEYYYLDTQTVTSNRRLADGYHEFYVQSYPPGYFDYWAGRGVVEGAIGWQGVMWEIINGDLPIFYLKVTGTDLTLVDGLLFQMGAGDQLLRIDGTYLVGEYSFSGTLTDLYGYTDDVSVDITFNDVPVAQDQLVSTDEDTTVPITLTATDLYPGTLSWTVVTTPSHGTLSGTAPELTFTPDLNYNGPDEFTFKVDDGTEESNTATVTITVNPVNDAPVADDQTVVTDEDTAKDITLTASDIDGDTLTWVVDTSPAHGTLTGTAPALLYTPDPDYNGPDSFTFKVNDGLVDSNVATVTITVTPVNDAPVALDGTIDGYEDTTIDFELSASDIDGDPLTYSAVSLPEHGVLILNPDGTGSYSPDANYYGEDLFTFMVNDGLVDSNTATVTITIYPVNDAPVADSQSVSTAEDTPLDITLTGSDVDGDSLTFTVVDQPTHGTLTGTAPALLYTPDPNYNGHDSFTFKVNDGTVDSDLATVNITVTPVNDDPEADSQSVSTAEDTPLGITLSASDVDNDPLIFSIVDQPAHGSLTGTAPNLTYNPDLNYNGTDSFTFKANDGTVDSNVATVTIDVTPVNDAPVADDQDVHVIEDTPKAITLTATDVDEDALTWEIVTMPSHGTLSGAAPDLLYTPDLDYNGPDSFTFKVNDGTVDSNTATVTISVTEFNDAPVADDQTVTTAEDTPKAITLTANDKDGDALSWIIVTEPSHGILSGIAPALTYTPDLNYNGPDSFTFKVNDGLSDSNVATVSIDVTPVNDAPVADEQTVSTAEDSAKAITLTATDVEDDPLTWTIVASPAHGELSGTAPALTYTPDADYYGSDSFAFKVNDGTVDSNEAMVGITVTPVNDAPVADDQAVSTSEDTAKGITLTASDIDEDSLTWTIVAIPDHGTLTGTAPALMYTPDSNYNGPDEFTFKVNDGTVDSNIATVTITVTPVNDAPVANDQSIGTNEDTPKNITLTATDVDGDELDWTVVTGPSHGTLSGIAPNLTYTPGLNYYGPDSFTFKVNDGTVDSNIATVEITVSSVNDAPVADDQVVSTAEDNAKNITLTASDVEGDPLTWTIVTGPDHGTLSGTAPELTYTPDANYNGPDGFIFKVNDGVADSNIASVTITVTPVNDDPVADDQEVVTDEDTITDITLTATDIDGDELTWMVVTTPTHGVLSGVAPELTYTPDQNYNGLDSFTFKVNDGAVDSNVATVSITITSVNDAPVADDQEVTADEDTPKVITLTANDVEGEALTWMIVTTPTHGTLSGTAPTVTYTPNPDYNGPDNFTFKVNDGNADSNIATITITVTSVNDAPVAVDDVYSTERNKPLHINAPGVLGNDTDPENDALSALLSEGPKHGELVFQIDGSFVYTPNNNYTGTDSFSYFAGDGALNSNAATVTITIKAVANWIFMPLVNK